jgi:hypothetical protein
MQKTVVDMTIAIKKDIVMFYTAKRVKETAEAALVVDVTAFLEDTDISAAMKRTLIDGATAKFLAAREDETTKIELKKKKLAGADAEKHRVEEDARLQLLAENDGSTVAAVVRELIAADKREVAAEAEVEMDLVELQKQNAAIKLQLQNHPDFPGVPWTQKAQEGKKGKGKGKTTQPPVAKAKGQGKCKGKGKDPTSTAGGGAKAGSAAAKGKGRGKGKSKKGGTRGGK